MSRLIDQKGLINFSTENYLNDYFPNSFGLERGRVVHLDVGIHVADVAVADQVHVTSYLFSNSNQRGVHHVVSRALIL